MTDPGPTPVIGGSGTNQPGTTNYLGNVTDPTLTGRFASPVHLPFGNQTYYNSGVTGYVKGDQTTLLPKDGGDLAALQQALMQAGYITQSQANQMVLGSPDNITTGAFAKLLATANLSGVPWQTALATRLAAAGQRAPAQTVRHEAVPPLTISLTNPDDIKKVAQQAAQTLNGTYLDDASLNAFIQSYQAQQAAVQTQQYHQQYDPNAVTHPTDTETVIGGYGPGGTTTNPATGAGLEQQLEDRIRAEHPNEVASNSFTAHLDTILSALRTPGAAR